MFLSLTRRHVHDELGELIGVAGTLWPGRYVHAPNMSRPSPKGYHATGIAVFKLTHYRRSRVLAQMASR